MEQKWFGLNPIHNIAQYINYICLGFSNVQRCRWIQCFCDVECDIVADDADVVTADTGCKIIVYMNSTVPKALSSGKAVSVRVCTCTCSSNLPHFVLSV